MNDIGQSCENCIVLIGEPCSENKEIVRHLSTKTNYSISICSNTHDGPINSHFRGVLILDLDTHSNSLAELVAIRSKGPRGLFKLACIGSNHAEEVISLCFALGAAEYLVKPIRLGEISAKIQRLIEEPSQDELKHQIDEVLVHNLTLREQQILRALEASKANGISRNEIHERVWRNICVNRKTLDVHIFNIRRKIRSAGFEIHCHEQRFFLVRLSQSSPGPTARFSQTEKIC